MPDWTYRTLLRPLFFRMGLDRARRLAVGTLRLLGKSRAGLAVIDFLGHLRADPKLELTAAGARLPGPVGLGMLVDPAGDALRSFSQFGAGFIEIGPVGLSAEGSVLLHAADAQRGEVSGVFPRSVALAEILGNLSGSAPAVPVWARLAALSPGECRQVAEGLAERVAAFLLPVEVGDTMEEITTRIAAVRESAASALVLLSMRPGEAELSNSLIGPGLADGVMVRAEIAQVDGSLAFGAACRQPVLAQVRRLREELPAGALIVAGGVLEAQDLSRLATAGANLFAVDAGLILSGPGLIKRCNEALLLSRFPARDEPESFSLAAARHSWFWGLMLGMAMLGGGLLALAIASTRVVLPYDEALCGMTRAQIAALNPKLLPFMAHDRVSLAGVMISLGFFYTALAWHAVRRGSHWAQVTVVVSATAGFFSFFLFLGFGYFDPFHAFVTAILFPMLLLCLFAPLSPPRPLARPEWIETAAWRRGQWGQLLFVALGVVILSAGLVLSFIGCTEVFVQDDLDFLGTTAAQLFLSSERLVPLVAHDRASLGGMLVSSGLAIWLAAQWGFRAGEAWLWRTLKWGGLAAFASAIVVHFAVGYVSVLHLIPAVGGFVMWMLALWLTRDWLLGRGSASPESELAAVRTPPLAGIGPSIPRK